MADSFDPYLKWLGIRNHGSGINHYRLLGLEPFESDVDAISSAAERQMRHVESFAVGENEEIGKRIILELRSARNCLLDPAKREAYDRELQQTKPPNNFPVVDSRESISVEVPAIQIGPDSATGNVASSRNVPAIRTRNRRRKKNPGFDVAGWLLGAIGAVAFAYVLFNTDLIDRIKGKSSVEPEVDIEKLVTTDNESKTGKLVNDRVNKNTKRSTRKPSKRKPKANENSGRLVMNAESNSDSASNPNLPSGPTETIKVVQPRKKLVVPETQKVQKAVSDLKESFKSQFADKSINGKNKLAKLLIENANDEQRPEYVWALAQSAMGLAADIGNLSAVTDAGNLVKRRFDNNYWEFISKDASRALSPVVDFEKVASEVGQLLDQGRAAGEFEFSKTFANAAARVVKKIGDFKQAEMLTSLSQDLNSLKNLKQQYEKLEKQNLESMSKANHLMTGRYFCYVLNDWKKGLEHISKGSDSAFASAAKTDLNAKSTDQKLVINEWLTLSMKPKYKGIDRRFLLERVQNKLGDAAFSTDEKKKIRHRVLEHIQVIKKFVNDPSARTRNVSFGMIRLGNQTLGPVFFERASSLVIGPKKKVRIPARKMGDGYFADYGSAGLQFKIRFMDNGWAEMRIKGKRSNFYTIWYGK